MCKVFSLKKRSIYETIAVNSRYMFAVVVAIAVH